MHKLGQCFLGFVYLFAFLKDGGGTDFLLGVVLKINMLEHSSLHGNFLSALWTNGLSAWQLKVLGSLKWEDADNFRYSCLKYGAHFQIFCTQYKLSKFYCNSDICILYFRFSCLCVLLRQCKTFALWCLMSCFLCGDSLTFCSK